MAVSSAAISLLIFLASRYTFANVILETTTPDNSKCSFGQFQCFTDGRCLHLYQKCDEAIDCADGSDEADCDSNATCLFNQFSCNSHNTCIPKEWVCDGRLDCKNGKDEMSCTTFNCPVNFLKCMNNRCVHVKFFCDGADDCGDGSDEQNCPTSDHRITFQCPADRFQCQSGPCIAKESICDGMKDCTHGEDEKNCATAGTSSCSSGYFMCGDSVCILNEWVCDGSADCIDASDERSCNHPKYEFIHTTTEAESLYYLRLRTESSVSVACSPSSFHCGSGECLDESQLCDGVDDCRDKSDEMSWCDACSANNGGCHHFCAPKPYGVHCSCRIGYRLQADGTTCRDPSECVNGNRLCDHYCRVVNDHYQCYCAFGYEPTGDGTHCKLIISDGFVLFSTGNEIRTVDLYDLKTDRLYGLMFKNELGSSIDAMDYSSKRHLTYYVSDDKIYFVGRESRSTCVLGGFTNGVAIAVDWVTENFYIAESDPAELGVCTWNGRYCHRFRFDDMDEVRGLAIHPRRGLMFWSDWGKSPRVERASMDGTQRSTIIREKLYLPIAVSIDYIHEKLYWADAEVHLIERCNMDGTNREIVVSKGAKHPTDLVVFSGKVFWTDWSTSSLIMADTRAVNSDVTTIHRTFVQPSAVTVNHSAYHNISLPNPCDDMTCSHICVLKAERNFSSTSASCLCSSDYFQPKYDTSSCYPFEDPRNLRLHWCVQSFRKACSKGHACLHNGTCANETFAKDSQTTRIHCQCTEGFTGLYCEVVAEKSLDAAALLVKTPNSGTSVGSGIALTIAVFFLALTIIYVLRRWDISDISKQITRFPAYIMISLRRTTSQREHILKRTTFSSNSAVFEPSISFSNPVYEEPRRTAVHALNKYKSRPVNLDDSGIHGSLRSVGSSSSPSML